MKTSLVLLFLAAPLLSLFAQSAEEGIYRLANPDYPNNDFQLRLAADHRFEAKSHSDGLHGKTYYFRSCGSWRIQGDTLLLTSMPAHFLHST